MIHLPPGATIGIIGGGQLGRMSAMAAARLGYLVHILTPEAESPASRVAAKTTVAPYADHEALRRFADAVDVITFEFENLPAESLDLLSSLKPVRPGAKILRISQDRLLEKQFLNDIGVPTAPWGPVHDEAELVDEAQRHELPCILKTTRLGYDGKGQALCRTEADCCDAFETLEPKPLILEAFVDFHSEISVIVARGENGKISSFDPVENRHKHHILDLTIAPAPLPLETLAEATAMAATARFLGGRPPYGYQLVPTGTLHPNPDKAMSDGAQSLYPDQLTKLVAQLRLLAPVVGRSVA